MLVIPFVVFLTWKSLNELSDFIYCNMHMKVEHFCENVKKVQTSDRW